MTEKYISVDLNDPRAEKIAEVISNKTSKKIISLLAEKEMSASEIASELKIPLNTVGYNIDKLIDSGLIEKVKGFLWSVKGKKIEKYRVSNKKVLISPKSFARGVLPTLLVIGAITLGIKIFTGQSYTSVQSQSTDVMTKSVETAGSVASSGVSSGAANVYPVNAGGAFIAPPSTASSGIVSHISNYMQSPETWAWFLLGALVSILVYLIVNQIYERRFR